ncbi:indoleamine 2,3-dioxygenase [Diutina catenulata]
MFANGFLPSELPLERLPQAYYEPWETLVANLPALILTKGIRARVDELPQLSTDELKSEPEWRRAYQVLSFLAHAYVWSESVPSQRLPEQLSAPWIATADHLGVPPIATYAAVCLWNFKQIIPDPDNLWNLDNLTTINTYTGSIDESWFYLVSVYFEYHGGYAIRCGTEATRQARAGNIPATVQALHALAESIDYLGSVLMRMEENCDPHVFYYRLRPFLAGWRNMGEVGLEKGVVYGSETEPRAYAGGSNAQSSLIQYLDVVLGIKHYATGDRPLQRGDGADGAENGFMDEMKQYMPREHREFLEEVDRTAAIRDFVTSQDDSELTLAYDACLAMMKAFRDKHIQIVTRYVVLQAKKTSSASTRRSGLAKQKKEEKGTGGTSLLPFLKQCRDETGDPAAGSWGKRILSDGVMRLKFSAPNASNED